MRSSSDLKAQTQIKNYLQEDPYAPRYHFIAPEGGCRPFDPNGAIFWKGRYHLFYIFQNANLPHEGHCWGHASSHDLLHWAYHPTALSPAKEDPEVGIFSGSAFVSKEGQPILIYHGVGAGTCIATAKDDQLIQWQKSPHNPVIPEPKVAHPGWGVYNVFDPHAWVEGSGYRVILGGQIKPNDLYDSAYLFKSSDLTHWEYVAPFYRPHIEWTDADEDCACPDFFKLGNKHVLLCISHPRGARYYVGQYQGNRFKPEAHYRLNWPGGPCFSPESLIDNNGRRIFWSWLIDQRKSASYSSPALGVMSLPRVMSLGQDGRVCIEPPEELKQLRTNHRRIPLIELKDGNEKLLTDINSRCLELIMEVDVSKGGVIGIALCQSSNKLEQTMIIYDSSQKKLLIDTTNSSLDPNIWRPYPIYRGKAEQQDFSIQEAPLDLPTNEPLKLQIFLDHSVVEVFANAHQCLTQRIYPTQPDSVNLSVFCQKGPIQITSFDIWEITPTNNS